MTAYVASNYVSDYYVTIAPDVAAVVGVASAPGPLAGGGIVGVAVVGGQGRAGSPLATPAATGRAVVTGGVSSSHILGAPSVRGRAVVSGRCAVGSPLAAVSCVGTVLRYELRGEVRDQGVLVNRRVRAHRRSDGALVAEADTSAGLVALPVGFAADEYYLVPINLDPAATDYAPPCANRVTSVLAMDVAA